MAVHIPHVPATFIHIPKTAGSAFSRWLDQHVPGIENRSKHCVVSEARENWPDLGTTFVFVRNPWDRMVSYWSFIGQRAQQRINNRLLGLPVKRSTTADRDRDLVDYYKKGFDVWINDLYHHRPNAFDLSDTHHRRETTQMHWAKDVDLVIRVEDFDRDFSKIQALVGCQQPLDRHNSSDHDHYRSYYDSVTQQMIREMYAEDIKVFGYEF